MRSERALTDALPVGPEHAVLDVLQRVGVASDDVLNRVEELQRTATATQERVCPCVRACAPLRAQVCLCCLVCVCVCVCVCVLCACLNLVIL